MAAVEPLISFLEGLDADADPAGAHFVEAHEILAHFFRGLDGQDKRAAAGFQAADEDADDLAAGIDQGGAALAALHGEIGADVRGGEEAALVLEIEAADGAEDGREREIHRVANGDDRGGDGELARIAEAEEGSFGVDLEDGDAAADIADEPLGRVTRATEGDLDVARFAAHGVGGVEGAVGINEEAGAGEIPALVGRLDAHHRGAALVEDHLHFVLERVERRGWRVVRGKCRNAPEHSAGQCHQQGAEAAPRSCKRQTAHNSQGARR